MSPSPGRMYWWRFIGEKAWRFGYCTYTQTPGLVRMGSHNGDTMGGLVVSILDIECMNYSGRTG